MRDLGRCWFREGSYDCNNLRELPTTLYSYDIIFLNTILFFFPAEDKET